MAIHFKNPKATFIHIPKTAGSSFQAWAVTNVDSDVIAGHKHSTVKMIENELKDLGKTFTFVRNPYDRLVSQFHFVGQRAQHRMERRTLGKKTKITTDPENDKSISDFYMLGFENWIETLYNKIPSPYDEHHHYKRGAPQTYWFDGNIDIVIKLENINNEFKLIQDLFDCYVDLPVTNTSKRSHYRDYYTNKEIRRMADTIVAPDLEKFGYKF